MWQWCESSYLVHSGVDGRYVDPIWRYDSYCSTCDVSAEVTADVRCHESPHPTTPHSTPHDPISHTQFVVDRTGPRPIRLPSDNHRHHNPLNAPPARNLRTPAPSVYLRIRGTKAKGLPWKKGGGGGEIQVEVRSGGQDVGVRVFVSGFWQKLRGCYRTLVSNFSLGSEM